MKGETEGVVELHLKELIGLVAKNLGFLELALAQGKEESLLTKAMILEKLPEMQKGKKGENFGLQF